MLPWVILSIILQCTIHLVALNVWLIKIGLILTLKQYYKFCSQVHPLYIFYSTNFLWFTETDLENWGYIIIIMLWIEHESYSLVLTESATSFSVRPCTVILNAKIFPFYAKQLTWLHWGLKICW